MEARSCTLVLVGPSGQGKSSTGNSILGRKAFSVKPINSGEPPLCRSEEKTLADGTIWKVIDTPDELNEEEFGELVCGRDPQAFLVVFSLRSMFLEEEQVAYLERLRDVFGEEIFLCTVVVFTNADVLEEDGVTLDDYLQSRPKLKDLLGFCQERRVLLENRSADATKKQSQVENLWHSVDTAVQHNGGRPYKYEGTIRIKVIKDHSTEFSSELDGAFTKIGQRIYFLRQINKNKSLVCIYNNMRALQVFKIKKHGIRFETKIGLEPDFKPEPAFSERKPKRGTVRLRFQTKRPFRLLELEQGIKHVQGYQ